MNIFHLGEWVSYELSTHLAERPEEICKNNRWARYRDWLGNG